jgi:hypothetical protein
LKREKIKPNVILSDIIFLKAIKGEARRIVDILNGKLEGTIYGTYTIPKVEYENIPEEIKKTIINKTTDIIYKIFYPALTYNGVIEQVVGEEWKKELTTSKVEK